MFQVKPWQPCLQTKDGWMNVGSLGDNAFRQRGTRELGFFFYYVGVCALTALNIYVNIVFLQPSGLRLPLKPKPDLCYDGISTRLRSETTL